MFLDPRTIESFWGTLRLDCQAFLPELILCSTIILLLVLRLFAGINRWHLGWESLVLTLVALAVSARQALNPPTQAGAFPREIFANLLVYDNFTVYIRLFLFGFIALVIWLSLLTGIPDREDSADFYCLLLGATVGMSIMASANHLLMVFIGVEMASLPSYALAGFLKGRRQSSEASLKYVVYGGGAAGVMLYGISLIAGKFGTGYLPDLAAVLPQVIASKGADPVLILGLFFILIGIAFKLAAVPFQFWCPDVFEGAAAEVAAFLSVASKGAALALLGRLALVLTFVPENPWSHPAALTLYLVPAIAFLAAITATFGNLAAYPQTNLKRLLAYSTIAHAGYMMMGLAPLITSADDRNSAVFSSAAASAVLFYLIAYLVMNMGAFAVVAFIRNLTGSEDLMDLRGLIYRVPILVITLGFFLLSLLGLPPLAGFAAKFQIFAVLFESGQRYTAGGHPELGNVMYALLVIGGINTVFSLVYYIRVLKVMIIDRPVEMVEGKEPPQLDVPPGAAFYTTVLAALILVIGLAWNPLAEVSDWGARLEKPPLRSPGVAARHAEDRP